MLNQNVKFSLTESQLTALSNIRAYNIPLRFILFTLNSDQRVGLLRDVFTAIFADDQHPNPTEAFNIYRLYISYYRFSYQDNKRLFKNCMKPFSYKQFIINDILEPFSTQTANLSFQSATKDLDLAAIFASNFLKEEDFKVDHLNFLVTS